MSLSSFLVWTILLSAIWGLSKVNKTSGNNYQSLVWSCFAWFILGVVLSRIYLWEPMLVQGSSMVPTLESRQRVVVNKHAFGLQLHPLPWRVGSSDPALGDIVVFKSPQGEYWVKRVVAQPGEQISYFPGVGWFKGENLLSLDHKQGFDLPRSQNDRPQWMTYLRLNSTELEGYPGWSFTIPRGRYFLLGDNHNNSIDSRNIGPVSNTRISGRIDP